MFFFFFWRSGHSGYELHSHFPSLTPPSRNHSLILGALQSDHRGPLPFAPLQPLVRWQLRVRGEDDAALLSTRHAHCQIPRDHQHVFHPGDDVFARGTVWAKAGILCCRYVTLRVRVSSVGRRSQWFPPFVCGRSVCDGSSSRRSSGGQRRGLL